MKQAAARQRLRGTAITFGLTIPRDAPHPAGAVRLAALILGEQGRRALRRAGFRPLEPATCAQLADAPPALRPLLARP
jgi:ABC-type molybdate transport system substrate-binding protein